MRLYTVIVLIGMTFHAVGGGLEWSETELHKTLHPLDCDKEYIFKCRNKFKEDVEIVNIRPSCGCLSIQMDDQVIFPGSNSTLRVTFSVQDRIGPQKKSIDVVTSAGKRKQRLYVLADIPEAYLLPANRMIWQADEARSAKTMVLKNSYAEAIPLERVTSSNEKIKVDLIPVRDGFEYQLHVTPQKAEERIRSVVRIYPAIPRGMENVKHYTVYVYLR